MRKGNSWINKVVGVYVVSGFICWAVLAHADMSQIKAYKEVNPDAKPKCIDCHMDKMPKKDDGAHDPNKYGEAIIKAAQAAKLDKPTADTYKSVGTIEDFTKSQAATK